MPKTNKGHCKLEFPGNDFVGILNIKSNLFESPLINSAIILPDKTDNATPCPEYPEAEKTFGFILAK